MSNLGNAVSNLGEKGVIVLAIPLAKNHLPETVSNLVTNSTSNNK